MASVYVISNMNWKVLWRVMLTVWLNLTLQDRASPFIEQLIFFH